MFRHRSLAAQALGLTAAALLLTAPARAAEEVAKDMKDVLKIHKVPDGLGGTTKLYEVNPPNQDQALFVALPNGNTMVASAGKDYVLDALDKESGKKKTVLKNKELSDLLK